MLALIQPNYENEVSNGYRLFDPGLKDDYAFGGWAPVFSWLGKEKWKIGHFPLEAEKFVDSALTWEGDELKSGDIRLRRDIPPGRYA